MEEPNGPNRVGIDIILQRRGHFDAKEESKSESEESSVLGLAPRECYSEKPQERQLSSSQGSEPGEHRNADIQDLIDTNSEI